MKLEIKIIQTKEITMVIDTSAFVDYTMGESNARHYNEIHDFIDTCKTNPEYLLDSGWDNHVVKTYDDTKLEKIELVD